MRNPRFVIRLALRREAGTAVKAFGRALGMQLYFVVATCPRSFDQRVQHLAAQPAAAQVPVHGQAADAAHARSLGDQAARGHGLVQTVVDHHMARRFVAAVDSAAVLVNASTRFTDGGEFGFGAEIGISTQKLHARGPMGLPEMTSTKYVVTGAGHTR